MATIGTFKKTGNEYTGSITTLSVQAKGVRIVPEETRTNDNAPSHRVFVGKAEIGAAWTKRSNEGRDYLGLKLDDPSFNDPIYANLFSDEGEETYSLDLVAQRQAQRQLGRTTTPRPGHPGAGRSRAVGWPERRRAAEAALRLTAIPARRRDGFAVRRAPRAPVVTPSARWPAECAALSRAHPARLAASPRRTWQPVARQAPATPPRASAA